MKKREKIKTEFVLKTCLTSIVRSGVSSVGTRDVIAPDFNPGETSNNTIIEFLMGTKHINEHDGQYQSIIKWVEPMALNKLHGAFSGWNKSHPYKIRQASGFSKYLGNMGKE